MNAQSALEEKASVTCCDLEIVLSRQARLRDTVAFVRP